MNDKDMQKLISEQKARREKVKNISPIDLQETYFMIMHNDLEDCLF